MVKKHAALAPGSVLTPGKTVPSGQVSERGFWWWCGGGVLVDSLEDIRMPRPSVSSHTVMRTWQSIHTK